MLQARHALPFASARQAALFALCLSFCGQFVARISRRGHDRVTHPHPRTNRSQGAYHPGLHSASHGPRKSGDRRHTGSSSVMGPAGERWGRPGPTEGRLTDTYGSPEARRWPEGDQHRRRGGPQTKPGRYLDQTRCAERDTISPLRRTQHQKRPRTRAACASPPPAIEMFHAGGRRASLRYTAHRRASVSCFYTGVCLRARVAQRAMRSFRHMSSLGRPTARKTTRVLISRLRR